MIGLDLYVGIDPGLTGAIAFYDTFEDELIVHDTPVYTVNKRRAVAMYALRDLIAPHADRVRFAVMEQVHSLPRDGHVGAFAFGKAAGAAEMALAAFSIATEMLTPQQWKRAMRCPTDKDAARQRASRLLPAHTANWTRKKDDGRAEAALMAVLAQRLSTERANQRA